MAKRVLRYQLTIDDQPHPVPAAPVVLFGRRQNPFGIDRFVDVWLEVDTPDDWPVSDHEMGDRLVQIVGTGHPIPETWTWLASFMDGPLVWHLYEVA